MKALRVFSFRNLSGNGLTKSVPSLCHGLVNAGVVIKPYAPRTRPELMSEASRMNVHAVVPGFASEIAVAAGQAAALNDEECPHYTRNCLRNMKGIFVGIRCAGDASRFRGR